MKKAPMLHKYAAPMRFLYFVAAWNVVGVVCYKVYKNNMNDPKSKDPEFRHMDSKQRFLSITVPKETKVSVIHVAGLIPTPSSVNRHETTIEEYVIPDIPAPPPSSGSQQSYE